MSSEGEIPDLEFIQYDKNQGLATGIEFDQQVNEFSSIITNPYMLDVDQRIWNSL